MMMMAAEEQHYYTKDGERREFSVSYAAEEMDQELLDPAAVERQEVLAGKHVEKLLAKEVQFDHLEASRESVLIVKHMLHHYKHAESRRVVDGGVGGDEQQQERKEKSDEAKQEADGQKAAVDSAEERFHETVVNTKLREGGLFVKHSRRGAEDYRLVWTSDDLKRIYWGHLKDGLKEPSNFILADDIVALHLGFTCDKSKPFAKLRANSLRGQRCFTIETAERTLDLETVSSQERDLWTLAFEHLLDVARRRRESAAAGTKSPDNAKLPPARSGSTPQLSKNKRNILGDRFKQLSSTTSNLQPHEMSREMLVAEVEHLRSCVARSVPADSVVKLKADLTELQRQWLLKTNNEKATLRAEIKKLREIILSEGGVDIDTNELAGGSGDDGMSSDISSDSDKDSDASSSDSDSDRDEDDDSDQDTHTHRSTAVSGDEDDEEHKLQDALNNMDNAEALIKSQQRKRQRAAAAAAAGSGDSADEKKHDTDNDNHNGDHDDDELEVRQRLAKKKRQQEREERKKHKKQKKSKDNKQKSAKSSVLAQTIREARAMSKRGSVSGGGGGGGAGNQMGLKLLKVDNLRLKHALRNAERSLQLKSDRIEEQRKRLTAIRFKWARVREENKTLRHEAYLVMRSLATPPKENEIRTLEDFEEAKMFAAGYLDERVKLLKDESWMRKRIKDMMEMNLPEVPDVDLYSDDESPSASATATSATAMSSRALVAHHRARSNNNSVIGMQGVSATATPRSHYGGGGGAGAGRSRSNSHVSLFGNPHDNRRRYGSAIRNLENVGAGGGGGGGGGVMGVGGGGGAGGFRSLAVTQYDGSHASTDPDFDYTVENEVRLSSVYRQLVRQWELAQSMLRTNERVGVPKWIPDSERPQCKHCDSKFTVINRRHHCRMCGEVFCGKCSSHTTDVAKFGFENVRVCNTCYGIQRAIQNPLAEIDNDALLTNS